MSEFQSDIGKTQYDEEGNEVDKHGFTIKKKPIGAEAVKIAVLNCEQLCGLDKNDMERIGKGTFQDFTTLDHSGRMSKKIVIEYDITQKDPADN